MKSLFPFEEIVAIFDPPFKKQKSCAFSVSWLHNYAKGYGNVF
jgi:hypothetical protein